MEGVTACGIFNGASFHTTFFHNIPLLNPSKLGRPITISDPYVRWLCAQHHAAKEFSDNSDLQLLQEADSRAARYARLLPLSTRRRKLAPVNTQQLTQQLEEAAQRSVYKLYSVIYHSQELAQFIASKAHSTETLRNHLIGVANWALFLIRMRASTCLHASASLVGQPGGTPGPVEVEDPRVADEPHLRGETRVRGPTLGGEDATPGFGGFRALRSWTRDVLGPQPRMCEGGGQ